MTRVSLKRLPTQNADGIVFLSILRLSFEMYVNVFVWTSLTILTSNLKINILFCQPLKPKLLNDELIIRHGKTPAKKYVIL
jgi:hypothetical protein